MPLVLTKPRDLDHLTRQMQNLLREMEVDLGKKLSKLAVSNTQVQTAQPFAVNDAVRLQDLHAVRNELLDRIQQQAGNQSASSAISIVWSIQAPLFFEEAPLGVIDEAGVTRFTPSQAVTTISGRPVGVLNYKGRIYPYSANLPPEPGFWAYDEVEGQVVLNDADVLEINDVFEFALAILA